MPSHSRAYIPHEHYAYARHFAAKVVDEIKIQLHGISTNTSNPEIAAIADSAIFYATSRIFLKGDPADDEEYAKSSPDASLRHKDATYPWVIIETSFSQKRKDLQRLVQDHILGSCGNVKLVVGLDIEYRRLKMATISVWRPDRT
jgi:hypothetical protein